MSSAPHVDYDRSQDSLPADQHQDHSKFSSIPHYHLPIATISRSTTLDPSLALQINEVKFFMRRLRCYWKAVADDLGPSIWAHPTNLYRQIWEQEISAADNRLEHLINQIRKTPGRINPNLNDNPFSFGLGSIGQTSSQKINAQLPHYFQLRTSREAEASHRRTLRRKRTRQRAKARRSAMEANHLGYQSFANSPHPFGTKQRSVTKERIEIVQSQILALGQRLTITSGPSEFPCDANSEERLFRFEENDVRENRVSSGSAGFDMPTSWKSSERRSKVDGDKYNEGPGSCPNEDINAYTGINARTFRPSFVPNIDICTITGEDISNIGSFQMNSNPKPRSR